ncbi:hypothetical protein LXL04_038605 [Taraxacum kok-saghyz]
MHLPFVGVKHHQAYHERRKASACFTKGYCDCGGDGRVGEMVGWGVDRDVGYPRDAPATVLFGQWFRFGKPSDQQFLFEMMDQIRKQKRSKKSDFLCKFGPNQHDKPRIRSIHLSNFPPCAAI